MNFYLVRYLLFLILEPFMSHGDPIQEGFMPLLLLKCGDVDDFQLRIRRQSKANDDHLRNIG
jgi:hypothetical protein